MAKRNTAPIVPRARVAVSCRPRFSIFRNASRISGALISAIGRLPNIESLQLDAAGVKLGKINEIVTDDYENTSAQGVYAIGDVNGAWPLTHVGKYEGDVVAANILGEDRPVNYDAVPRVTYTDPQAGAVGANEAPFSGTAKRNSAIRNSKAKLTMAMAI